MSINSNEDDFFPNDDNNVKDFRDNNIDHANEFAIFRRISSNDINFNPKEIGEEEEEAHIFSFDAEKENIKPTKITSKEVENKFIMQPKTLTVPIEEKRIIKFISKKKINRGMKPKSFKKGLKTHKASDKDNVERKEKVSLMTFGINLANDFKNSCIGLDEKSQNFLQIDYNIKKNIIKEKIEELTQKGYQYKRLFELEISAKNLGCKCTKNKIKIKPKISNLDIYNNLVHDHPQLEEFFEQDFINILKDYYLLNKSNSNNQFYYKNYVINISPKTKTFCDLLEKNENKDHEEIFRNVLAKYFNLNEVKKGVN